jgi:hypothetical protein
MKYFNVVAAVVEVVGAVFIDLEKVVEFVKAELPDVECLVQQTGGGVATIYLGSTYVLDVDGEVLPEDRYDDLLATWCVPVMGGPGHFQGPHWTEGRSYAGEFSIGYEVNDPLTKDDRGVDGWDLDLAYGPDAHSPYSGERVVARRMIQLYRQHPRVKAGEVR